MTNPSKINLAKYSNNYSSVCIPVVLTYIYKKLEKNMCIKHLKSYYNV